MDLIATRITDRLAAMAAELTPANGYPSNIGANVLVARLDAIGREAPACILLPGRSRVEVIYNGRAQVTRSYTVQAFVDTRQHPSTGAHALADQVLWDLRRRFETYDTDLYALIDSLAAEGDQPGYSQDGGALVGGALDLSLTYRVALDDPSAAL